MKTENDFKEFIALLNKNNVEYLIVGGYAYSYYAEPRFTKDIDFLIYTSAENAQKMMLCLNEFGFGGIGLKAADFMEEGQTIQLGQAPVRIDIITSIEGVLFKEAWENRTIGAYGDIPANFISKSDLIVNKRASARPRDIADIAMLEKI